MPWYPRAAECVQWAGAAVTAGVISGGVRQSCWRSRAAESSAAPHAAQFSRQMAAVAGGGAVRTLQPGTPVTLSLCRANVRGSRRVRL